MPGGDKIIHRLSIFDNCAGAFYLINSWLMIETMCCKREQWSNMEMECEIGSWAETRLSRCHQDSYGDSYIQMPASSWRQHLEHLDIVITLR